MLESPRQAGPRVVVDREATYRQDLVERDAVSNMASASNQKEDAAAGTRMSKAALSYKHAAAWRPDIDGLRALAVGPVVIFHLAQSVLPGGFVGVDIFFVISGYLISRNIFRQAAEGRFSIRSFYEHRLRRIFPAYFAVLLAVFAVALIHEMPPDTVALGKSLLAALGSVTNFFFWATTNYFEQPAEKLPLLHTWSLSVEEQFYLLFPAMILLVHQRGQAWMQWCVLIVFAMSLAISIPGAFLYPTATFYLLPTRAWELMTGTILALGVFPDLRNDVYRAIAATVGLGLIVLSMMLLSPQTPFPGLAAIPPCLGAALIIFAGSSGSTLVTKLLSLKPLVFIGLISYSLYLWHWPLLALQRADMLFFEPQSKLAERSILLAMSLLLATASWWFIERPTRNRTIVSTRALVSTALLATVTLVAGATTLILTDGLPARYAPQTVKLASYLNYDQRPQFLEGQCFLDLTADFSKFDKSLCLPNKPNAPNYILFGDSHAAHLASGLREALPDANILQVTGVQCPPLLARQPNISRSCPNMIKLASEILPKERKIDKVWLSAAWNGSRLAESAGWNKSWLEDLKQTAEYFRSLGIAVVIIGPSPEYNAPLPTLLARGNENHNPGLAQQSLVPDPFILDRSMAEVFKNNNNVTYVSLMKRLCETGTCRDYADKDVPLYFDASHFGSAGSRLIAKEIVGDLQ